jgi:hypothetical protein
MQLSRVQYPFETGSKKFGKAGNARSYDHALFADRSYGSGHTKQELKNNARIILDVFVAKAYNSFLLFIWRVSSTRTPTNDVCTYSAGRDEARIAGAATARRHASTSVSSLVCQTLAFRAPRGAKHDHWISPFLSVRRPHYARKGRLMLTTKRNGLARNEEGESQMEPPWNPNAIPTAMK